MAQSTRPQLASAPNMAALNRVEWMTLRETARAISRVGAWVTVHSSSLVAPSPSPASSRQSCSATVVRAATKTV